MGFQVEEFTYNNFTYTNTYHRLGFFKWDRKRKIGNIISYIYKNKEVRDNNVNSFFLTIMLDVKQRRFNKYFNNNKCLELCAYTYLKNTTDKYNAIDYTNAELVFDSQEQQTAYNDFINYLQNKEDEEDPETYIDP